MNYNKYNKSQLVSQLKEKDREISKLVDHILLIEQSNADRLERAKSEVGLFLKDLVAVIKFTFELGAKTRKSLAELNRPLLVQKT